MRSRRMMNVAISQGSRKRWMGRPLGRPIPIALVGRRPSAADGARLRAVLVEVRVEAATEQGREVPVRAGVADVVRVLHIPLRGEGVDDVVRVELATLLELHAFLEMAGPRLQVGARVTARGQSRLRVEPG